MKKIFLVMAIAFAFTTAMAVATVVAYGSVFRVGIRRPFGIFVTACKFSNGSPGSRELSCIGRYAAVQRLINKCR